MDILAEYKSCLRRLRQYKEDERACSMEIERSGSLAQQKETEIRQLQVQMQSASEAQTRRKLTELITQRQNEIRAEIDAVDRDIDSTKQRADAECREVASRISINKYSHELAQINQARKILARGKEIISSSIPPEILASVANAVSQDTEVYDILTLTGKVEDMLERIPDTIDVPVFRKVIKACMLDTELFHKWNPRMRLVVHGLWFATLLAVFVYVPMLFVLPYSVLLASSVYTGIGKSRKLIGFCYPYKLLESRVDDMLRELNQRVEAERGREYAQIMQKREQLLTTLGDTRNKLTAKLSSVESEVRNGVSLSDVSRQVQEDYMRRIKAAQDSIERSRKETAKQTKLRSITKDKYEELLARKEELKQLVQDNYLNPSKPGTSKLLIKSFFLGMDNQEELIEFNYKGLTTLIIYKGDTSEVNAPLITMMMIQLLAGMSIASTQIAITDVFGACTSYAQFSPTQLEKRIRLCPVTASINAEVDRLHDEMIRRNSTILTEAPSIEEFNQMMLQRKSLTQEYYLLFLQDPDFKLLSSQKFLQICRSGPRVGIVPFVFVSHLDMNKMKQESSNVISGLLGFLESVAETSNVYSFDGRTQDLTSAEDSVYQVIDEIRLSAIEKGR